MRRVVALACVTFAICCSSTRSALPNYDIVPLGLTGIEHTRNDGHKDSSALQLNEAGQVIGNSLRYNGGSSDLGRSVWLYDGATTRNIGLVGGEHTRDDGYKASSTSSFSGLPINESGQVIGLSDRYNGEMFGNGYSAWLYNGVTTLNIGLVGSEHTRGADNYKDSRVEMLNEAGQVVGTSERFNFSSDLGQSAWLYNGATTLNIGLVGSEHTHFDGFKFSDGGALNEAGQATGSSRRYNGVNGTPFGFGSSAWFYDGATTLDIGLVGIEHTRNDGYKYSLAGGLNEAGQVVGISHRFNGGTDLGQTSWLYDGVTTRDIGLVGIEHTRNDGYKVGTLGFIPNEAGQTMGNSQRFNGGSTNLGQSAWLYNGATTLDIGLVGIEHTRNDGYKNSNGYRRNEAGQVTGESYRFNGGSTDLGRSAWLYNGATTLDIGLVGIEHTRNNGYKYTFVGGLSEAGQVIGYSDRYNGGSTSLGRSALLYNGATTLNIGLVGSEHTRNDGYKFSDTYDLNEAGQVIGYSDRYNGGSTSLGRSAWLYDPVLDQTFEFELSTRSDGYAFSSPQYLGEDGLVLGTYSLFDNFNVDLGRRAFYFTIEDGLHDLGSLVNDGLENNGWDWLADAIRANGLVQILGHGKLSSQSGGRIAYLLTGKQVVESLGNVAVAGGNEVHAWDSAADSWSSTTFLPTLGGPPVTNLVGAEGNFVAVAGDKAAAWNGGSQWLHTDLGGLGDGAPITRVVESLGNVAVAAGNEVQAWDSTADSWSSTTFLPTLGGPPVTNLVGAEGNFVAVAGDKAAAWNGGSQWLHTDLGGLGDNAPITRVVESLGNVAVAAGNEVQAWDSAADSWSSTTFIGGPIVTNLVEAQGNFVAIAGDRAAAWNGGSDWLSTSLADPIVGVVVSKRITAGDYNDNGIVDAADYVVWRNNLGAPAGTLPNDANGGTIGQGQYSTWRASFGNTASSPSSTGANVAVAGGNEVHAWDSAADSWSSTSFIGGPIVTNLVGAQGNFVAVAGDKAAAWNGGSQWLHTDLGGLGDGAPITRVVESLGNVAVAAGNEVQAWDSTADSWSSTTFLPTLGGPPVTNLVGAEGNFVAVAGDKAAAWNGGSQWLHTDLGGLGDNAPITRVVESLGNVAVAAGNEVQAWDSTADSWSSTTFLPTLGGPPVTNLVGAQGNFVAVAGDKAAAWNGGSQWLHTDLGGLGDGAPITRVVESLGNVAVAAGNEVQAWDSTADSWSSTTFLPTLGGPPVTNLVGAEGNFVAVAGDKAAAWNGGSQWLHTDLGGLGDNAPITRVVESLGNVAVAAGNEVQAWDSAADSWSSTTFIGGPIVTNLVEAQGNFVAIAGDRAAAWNGGSQWLHTDLGGLGDNAPITQVVESLGNVAVAAGNEVQAWDSAADSWSSTAFFSSSGGGAIRVTKIVGAEGNFVAIAGDQAAAWNGGSGWLFTNLDDPIGGVPASEFFVPEPASMWLLILGIGLGILIRRQNAPQAFLTTCAQDTSDSEFFFGTSVTADSP